MCAHSLFQLCRSVVRGAPHQAVLGLYNDDAFLPPVSMLGIQPLPAPLSHLVAYQCRQHHHHNSLWGVPVYADRNESHTPQHGTQGRLIAAAACEWTLQVQVSSVVELNVTTKWLLEWQRGRHCSMPVMWNCVCLTFMIQVMNDVFELKSVMHVMFALFHCVKLQLYALVKYVLHVKSMQWLQLPRRTAVVCQTQSSMTVKRLDTVMRQPVCLVCIQVVCRYYSELQNCRIYSNEDNYCVVYSNKCNIRQTISIKLKAAF